MTNTFYNVLTATIISLFIFSYPSVGQEIELLGHLDPGSAQYSSCWGYTAPDGREYALLGMYEGTSIIDITDPENLTEVAFIPGAGPNSIWREMKTYSHYAYIVSEGDFQDGGGLQIIDLSMLPDTVEHVQNWTYPGFSRAHTISQDGPYLYLNGGNATHNGGIAIISVVDPENPVKVGEWTDHYVHDSHIRNDTIYASGIQQGDGLSIIDAQDKSNPVFITQITYPGSGTHNAWTTKDGYYVITTDETGTTNKNLKFWDIRDLDDINLVAEFTPNPEAIVHNVYVRGDYAHVAWYTEGYVVVDITDPENPVLADSYNTSNEPHGTFAGAWNVYPFYPSGKTILSDMQNGLFVFYFDETPVTGVPEFVIQTPGRIHLKQNYPNPFNPTTTIRYEIPEISHVALRIYDVLGRKIATLVDTEQVPGSYKVQWDAAGVAGGIYFYRLETEKATRSRTLHLIK